MKKKRICQDSEDVKKAKKNKKPRCEWNYIECKDVLNNCHKLIRKKIVWLLLKIQMAAAYLRPKSQKLKFYALRTFFQFNSVFELWLMVYCMEILCMGYFNHKIFFLNITKVTLCWKIINLFQTFCRYYVTHFLQKFLREEPILT